MASFYLVGNIPGELHSSDLRAFFSQLVEKGSFKCFHYRHRPEHQGHSSRGSPSPDDVVKTRAKTNCCVVELSRGAEGEFVRLYQNKNWMRLNGEYLHHKVRITKLRVRECDDSLNNKELKTAVIPLSEVRSLPELNPPSVMPLGNVGTPLSTFMGLIRSCKLPSHVIKKLRLEFPKSRSKKRYGAVGLDYGTTVEEGSKEGGATEERGYHGDEDRDDEEPISSDDEHDAEEWERYEALHEDVDKQGRTKERLFEEELEVVWDKGSSGLVFYTDASYWDQQDGDFDEKCSQEDDWDVDTSLYYDHEQGDKDARDLRDIEIERRLREGLDDNLEGEIGGFEKHTKGIGSKVLRRSGWTEGKGVGASNQGISEPLESDGQHPHIKRGLGYRGEKLNRNVPSSKRQKRSQDVIISTVYDRPDEEKDTAVRSAPPTTIKYRREHLQFLGGGILKPNTNSGSETHSAQGL